MIERRAKSGLSVKVLLAFLFFAAVLLTWGCSPGGESGIEGVLLFGDQPLVGAQVEVYLKAEKDRSTVPFSVGDTDEAGRYRISLPPGRYFLIGKKKEPRDDGRMRMLMAESPANPLEVGKGMKRVAAFALREMGRDGSLIPDPGTGVVGRVTVEGDPLAEAFVYVYTEETAGLMGPSYGEAVQTGEDGRFQVDLPAGRYYLVARKRADGSRIGEPASGDLNGAYPGNPVSVKRGTMHSLSDLPVVRVDDAERRNRLSRGKFDPTETFFTGRIVDQDGDALAGIYVFAYLDSRMVGKPTYISAPTGEKGGFRLYLGEGGTYYVGARSTYGGPLEPGEWVGTFDGRADHGVDIATRENRSLGEIVVREVW